VSNKLLFYIYYLFLILILYYLIFRPTNLASKWGSKDCNDRIKESNDFGIELNPYKQNKDNLKRESEHLEEGGRSPLSGESQEGRMSLILQFKNRDYIDSDDDM
jgi:hypothetical protein